MSFMDQVRLAIKIEEAREALRNLWGDEYTSLIAPHREVVRTIAAARKCSPLAVPPLLKDRLTAMQMLAVIAAAADEAEA